MVLAAGLTSRREPASFSRRLVEAGLGGYVDLIVTEVLVDELYRVPIDPKFIGRMSDDEATAAIAGLVAVAASFVVDSNVTHPPLTDDPDDDYLAHAAMDASAFPVTRDDAAGFGHVLGLRVGRPGTALHLGALDEEGEG
jgi:predicted nucleic acid-binding protein